ncbi:MAG: SusC/RagA family TonB-linked outer membrane protein [Rhodothermaceae bacterium]|nr:MAG: SusC/RagA family TonB-linked outer membrane protein [Rhodothermaceae bacterium]
MKHRVRRHVPLPPARCLLGCLSLLLLMLPGLALGQAFPVRGIVLSAVDGTPLPGVNIVEVGTQNGTATDAEGRFRLTVSSPNATLAVSFVGFLTQNVPVNGQSELTIRLQEDVAAMEEVVVTAFGIERQERAVGFSVGEVSGEDLRQARENNVALSLSGKVAGVVVSKPASGPGGSSRVVIRGNTSLEGNNQPLYVVDGIPIDNSNLGSAGMWGGQDLGDGISSLNPDDIETITVLKGPAAAALYGTRAQNGVILITTKTGRETGLGGIGVEYNANVTFEDILVRYDFQDQYGQGTRGKKPATQDEALAQAFSAWGARLDGSPVVQFDGVARPYQAVGSNMERFYETAITNTNTLSLNGTVGSTALRASFSRLNSESIVPNSGLERYTVSLRGTSNFGSRLSSDVKVNYVRDITNNRSELSDAPRNANWSVAFLPPNVNVETMKPGYCVGDPDPNKIICPQGTDENAEFRISESVFQQNPYWSALKFTADDTKDRIIGHALLSYKLLDWLTVQGRVGQDWYKMRRTRVQPYGTAFIPRGSIDEVDWTVQERNFDFLFTADRPLTQDLHLNASVGGNKLRREFEQLSLNGSNFSIPGLETISNASQTSNGFGVSKKEINSLYGSAEFAYRDYLFLTVTGRNDWSSTLPVDNNSYFYPSVSASFVFSDAFTVPTWLTYGKVRASWAEVGGDTDPYRLSLTYALGNFTHQGQPVGRIAQTSIPLADLKPSSLTGWEVGFDTRLFDNRIGVDFTYYFSETNNQILSTTVPVTTGYSAKIINAGAIQNRGVEVLLNLTPLRTARMRWDLDVNFARNISKVTELLGDPACAEPFPPEDVDCTQFLGSFDLGGRSRIASGSTMGIFAEVGRPYGIIKGFKYARDANGNIILDDAGLPVQGAFEELGNGNPDWTAGITNTFRYKNITVSALLDISVGGEIFSGTNAQAYASGLHKNTLVGRAECDAAGYDAPCWTAPGVVFPDGIPFEVGDKGRDGLGPGDAGYTGPDEGEGNGLTREVFEAGTPNTTKVYPEDYYGRIVSQIAEEFVYDASYVKLRQLQVSYRLPTRWLARTPVRMATISLVGRNLLILHKNIPNVDPESNLNVGNAQGTELAGVPQVRSIGFNLNLRF